jgi:hypothetical protein
LGLAAASCSLEEGEPLPAGGGSGGTAGTGTGGKAGTSAGGSSGGMTPMPTGGMAGTPAGGMAGTGGMAGNGGGAMEVTVDNFAGKVNEHGFAFKDSYFLVPCQQTAAHDCLTVQGDCPDQGAADFEDKGSKFEEFFQLGGEMGKTYTVKIRVNGIVEGKYYRNGTRRAGNDTNVDWNVPQGTDAWYVGGEAIPSSYNVFKIQVLEPNPTPDKTKTIAHYYLNSFPQDSGLESHQTVPIGYEAEFDVPGEGWIRYLNQDSNCRAINNCGPGDNGPNCPSARNVPNEPGLAVPETYGSQPVTNINRINGAQQPFHAQMVHVTVLEVKEKM